MPVEQTAYEIIQNALTLSRDQVSSANRAAQGAITAASGYTIGSGVSPINYWIQAQEPNVESVPDATLTYEANRDQLIALLSSKLADFFATYYPLASDAFDAGTNWVLNAITLGGTGISPAVEDQIWQRGRDRVVADGLRVESQAVNEFASRGFSLPPGTLAARLQETRFAQLTKTQELARDVSIKQAELEVDNLRFAVDLAIKTRLQALDAAANYIHALMSGPDIAARIASLNADAKAHMVSATADLYRARISRDEVAMRIPLAEADNAVKRTQIGVDGFYKGVASRVQAASAAADAYARTATAALASLNSVASVSAASFSSKS